MLLSRTFMSNRSQSKQRDKELRRVAILVETSTQWGRQIVLGIKSYVERHQKWHVFIEPHGSNEVIHIPSGWAGDGIIADIHSPESFAALKKTSIPIVNVSDVSMPGSRFPQVAGDIHATADLAAKYYQQRGYSNMAYIGLGQSSSDYEKCRAFEAAVGRIGGRFIRYEVKPRAYGVPDWNLSLPSMAEWLLSLPKPAGLLSWSVGHEVIEACRIAGLRLPEEISLLMFSYDEIFLEMPEVSLSGIMQASAKVGYDAAALLDQLMKGATFTPRMNKKIPPLGINSRTSTDSLAIPDRLLTKAIKYIYSNLENPLGVNQLAAHVGVSRRLLERRFGEVCRQTPAEYIRTAHLDRAKQLLRDTTLSIPDVAQKSGFTSPDYMGFAFKKGTGTTPLKYRKEMSILSK